MVSAWYIISLSERLDYADTRCLGVIEIVSITSRIYSEVLYKREIFIRSILSADTRCPRSCKSVLYDK